jgi:ubiquinone/menaquinone biosynthesis C-methylase UbiE
MDRRRWEDRLVPSRSSSAWFFDRWSAVYDRPGLQLVAYRPVHDAVLTRLGDAPPSRILDLGCGTGQLAHRLADRFPDAWVLGIDLSAGMLTEAADRLGPVPSARWGLLRADAERLPVRFSSVDVVVCTESFHWYRHQGPVLDGLGEVLRPDGRLLIASIATVTEFGDRMLERLTRYGGRPIRAVSPSRLRRLLNQAGFKVLNQQRIPRLGPGAWPVLTEARRR